MKKTTIEEISQYQFDPKNNIDWCEVWKAEQNDIYDFIAECRIVRIKDIEIAFSHIKKYKIEKYLIALVEEERIYKDGFNFRLEKAEKSKSLIQSALSQMLKSVDLNNAQMQHRSGLSETEISSLKSGKRAIKLEKAFLFAEKIGKSTELLQELNVLIKEFTKSVKKENILINQLNLFDD